MHERVLPGSPGVSTQLWQCPPLPLIELSQHCLRWRRNLNSGLTSLQLFRPCVIWRLAGLPGSRLACTQIHGALAFPAGTATGAQCSELQAKQHPPLTPQRAGCSPSSHGLQL